MNWVSIDEIGTLLSVILDLPGILPNSRKAFHIFISTVSCLAVRLPLTRLKEHARVAYGHVQQCGLGGLGRFRHSSSRSQPPYWWRPESKRCHHWRFFRHRVQGLRNYRRPRCSLLLGLERSNPIEIYWLWMHCLWAWGKTKAPKYQPKALAIAAVEIFRFESDRWWHQHKSSV